MAGQHAPARTGPVFVDPTGRRSRAVARTCWVLGALCVAYVALVIFSLLLPPGLSRLAVPGLGPVLPGPGAAPLGAVDGRSGRPEVLLAPARPSPRPSRSARPASVPPRPTPDPALSPRPSRTSRTSSPGSPAATPSVGPPGQQPSSGPRRVSSSPRVPPGRPDRSPKPRPSNSRGPR